LSSRTPNQRLLPIAVSVVGVVAAFVLAVAVFTGWPPALAIAATFEAPQPDVPMLGVDESTAVAIGPAVPIGDKFEATAATSTAQATAQLMVPSVKKVAKAVAKWRRARVSWYGPGFYGNGMAGGGKLKRDSMVVAHRSLPFGTKVLLAYKGRSVTAVVKDRGPFVRGRVFDLGPGTAKALGFSGVGTIQYAIVR